ncbi:glycosyltransferase family 4 protein [Paenibacillus flagellatus]|uniref:Glycosyl transferase family 1 domain-containing protein n=1 Tax=Paenibacillus flagellatus TaxID=2211139 RepID=A0A2V5K6X3_9BACL|nr:glycosyltransferase family 4 protein [Paenibacillus flagellatus]PYI53563.1 hypothetical protein DLM86_17540 [Paenibacillus flagellatus]
MSAKKVSIYTLNQLLHHGKQPAAGGLERYMRDIAVLMREMGYDVNFVQNGTHRWKRDYMGFTVYGVPMLEGNVSDIEAMDRVSHDRVLYGWVGQQETYKDTEGIVINHGIWWDDANYDLERLPWIIPNIVNGLDHCKVMVTVDTAFLNWCRSTIGNRIRGKLRYIPNYVDLNMFRPEEKTKETDFVTVLYPRRISPVRGIELAKRLSVRLLGKYAHVKFKFAVDHNHPQLWNEFVEWADAHPYRDRLDIGNYYFDDIPNAYREADIVLLPTIQSEGTSFSCLESMGCGKAIVTTAVGGMTDLILDGFNGRLVMPEEESLFEALCELIEDGELRRTFGHHAYMTAKAFSKERWEAQWAKWIAAVYG